jgi:hypothetical protein
MSHVKFEQRHRRKRNVKRKSIEVVDYSRIKVTVFREKKKRNATLERREQSKKERKKEEKTEGMKQVERVLRLTHKATEEAIKKIRKNTTTISHRFSIAYGCCFVVLSVRRISLLLAHQ